MVNMKAVHRAFKELESLGYFAPRKRFMCCGGCAVAAIPEDKGEKFVYYHEQDYDHVKEGRGLYIGWAGEASVIHDCLTHQGLVVEHDGTDNTRFLVKP